MRPYNKFFSMMIMSFVIMYGVMFLNVDNFQHIYLSVTRLYMALLMVAPMALIMLLMMKKMYSNKKMNQIIIVCAMAVFSISLWLLRTQTPVGDRQYMKAMIPHHSSAIMTSKHADLTDPRVKKLSESIIASQKKEIEEMKMLLNDIK